MKTTNATNANKTNSFGEWILANRPNERLTDFLLLPLGIGAIINMAILALYLTDCGTFGTIVAWIIFIIVAGALYGIFFELFNQDDELFSFKSIWAFVKYTFVMQLSGLCYWLLWGFITIFASDNLMGMQLSNLYSQSSDLAFAGILLLLGMTVLFLCSICAFKSESPRAASWAAILLILAAVANFLCFVFIQ